MIKRLSLTDWMEAASPGAELHWHPTSSMAGAVGYRKLDNGKWASGNGYEYTPKDYFDDDEDTLFLRVEAGK